MKTAMKLGIAGICAMLLACQPPAPVPTPNPILDAETGNRFEAACFHMNAIGCPEGAHPNCVNTLQKSESITAIDVDCLGRSKTVADVRDCGVTCAVKK